MIASRLNSIIAFFCLTAASITAAACDHPFHQSRATIEFNAETCSFEVSLFMFPDDLEQGLETFSGRDVSLENEKALDELLQKYVDKKFELRLGDAQPRPMTWVGHELKTQEAWLYFEFPVDTENPTDMRLKNTLFMDLFDDQINVAYVQIGGRQRCITHRTDTASWQNWTVTRSRQVSVAD